MITAWSYSRLACYEKCPQQAKYRYIDKVPEKKHPAAERGIRVHEECAEYLAGKRTDPTPEIKNFGTSMFDNLKELRPLIECKYAFDKKWRPVAWFAPDTWVRMIFDVAKVYDDGEGLVIDHKTGKPYGDYSDQISLFAAGLFAQYPECQSVEGRLWFLDHGAEEVDTISRDEFPALQQKWETRAAAMLNDRTFPARPGQHCRWCSFSRAAGGPCKFG